jgi:bloom syndrome protein
VTIVISPLLSLMNDQVNHLQKLHIQAFLVNGEKAQEERNLVYNALRGPYPDQFIQLLYITPEMIGKSDALLNVLAGLHEKKKLARIVVDEAHCVSQWGHDFRPDYKTISKVRMKFPGVPLIALTATATENVKADCIHNLGMEGCEEYKQSFNRPNLYYEIQPKKGKGATAEVLEKIASLIKNDYKNQTGIVYTLSRAGCEELAEKLRDRGIKAYHFHASMPPEEKNSTQRDWQSGKLQVVVATIAFGMGIDKPDVRFVIHHTLPKSLEGYYQETGRAGRDGKLSKCILFYGYQDTSVLKRFIDENEAASEDVKERQREMLTRMIQYCENRTDCRRADILSYFGESFAKEDCNHTCDNCNSDAMFEQQDMTNHATAALNMVKKLSSRNVTMVQVNDLLRGLNHAKTKDYHDVEGFGVARDLPKVEVQRLLTRLVMEGALEEYHVVNKSSFASQYIQVSLIYSEREVC